MKSKIKLNTGEFVFNQVVRTTEIRNSHGELTDVKVEREPVTIPAINVEIETEYQPSEILDYWNIAKTIMKEAPEEFKNFVIGLAQTYKETESAVQDITGGVDNGDTSN